MKQTSIIAKYFVPITFLTYTALTAMVVFFMALRHSVQILIFAVATVGYALLLGITAKDLPPIGENENNEEIVRSRHKITL